MDGQFRAIEFDAAATTHEVHMHTEPNPQRHSSVNIKMETNILQQEFCIILCLIIKTIISSGFMPNVPISF